MSESTPAVDPGLMPQSTPRQLTTESDITKLIHALNAGFTQLNVGFTQLAEQNKDQAEKLQTAIESLKPPVLTTDKETAFWNAYKTVADEYDNEFSKKWDTDLDTALIFAGLFSAVTSAFIILIQPEILPHGTPAIVIIAQGILYISLGSTLLAALLAVLGKQWLMYYSAAGNRGPIKTRGLERQRKLDGLLRWKFNKVMQIFPLLLQLGLFLFSAALSIYLWTIHLSLAIIVLAMTSMGFICYIALLSCMVASPDSPFYSPIVPLATECILWVKSTVQWFTQWVYSTCTASHSEDTLPWFSRAEPPQNVGTQTELPPFTDPTSLKLSLKVPAISWILETSTDPNVLTAAAEVAVGLQWPIGIDLTSQLVNLRNEFLICFNHAQDPAGGFVLWDTRDGMAGRALSLGRAYCTLRCVHTAVNADQEPRVQLGYSPLRDSISPSLINMTRILEQKPDLNGDSETPVAPQWALKIIPSFQSNTSRRGYPIEYFLGQFKITPHLDEPSFTDYLFCAISFLCHVNHCDIVRNDKSQFQEALFKHLFTTLQAKIQQDEISLETATEIIQITGLIATQPGVKVWHFWFEYSTRRSIAYGFLSSISHSDKWMDVALAIGMVTGEPESFSPYRDPINGKNIEHYGDVVNKILEEVKIPPKAEKWDGKTAAGVAGLLWCLIYDGTQLEKQNIPLILHSLSLSGNAAACAVHLLLEPCTWTWYENDDTRPTLQSANVWSSLMEYFVEKKTGGMPGNLLELGNTLMGIPDWQSHIYKELCSLITNLFQDPYFCENYQSYNSILSSLSDSEDEFPDQETPLSLSLAVLSRFWGSFGLSGSDCLHDCVQWLRSTCLVVLRDKYLVGWPEKVSMDSVKAPFLPPLQSSILNVATSTRQKMTNDSGDTRIGAKQDLEDIINILEHVATGITLPNPDEVPINYEQLREKVLKQIEEFEATMLARSHPTTAA
ncbi:hypothetical protein K438DRAFT_1854044 [Mycena galopus ATCC 62051]|nr:hypothetical protein K438DRAFT_1854044 [Mycena galopus ATCC 62051]